MAKLGDERLVYVGETHTALEDHLVQLAVLKEMAKQPGELAVGIEWIQADFQPALDRYLAGKIDEAEFLRDSEYYDRWRFDFRFYRPILVAAKELGIPVIALNASRELTDAISEKGLDGLSATMRRKAPAEYDFSDQEYAGRLRQVFEMHAKTSGNEFQRFLEVQLTWDETMAENVANYLKGGDNRRMLVLAGKGHVDKRSGIPNRVTRRTGLRGVTVGSYRPNAGGTDSVDYLVLADERKLPPAGLMRVFLDETDDGVIIREFSADSPAAEAGIEKGDRLVAINNEPIRFFADVKIQLMDRSPGDEISVRVARPTPVIGDEFVNTRIRLAGAGG